MAEQKPFDNNNSNQGIKKELEMQEIYGAPLAYASGAP